MGLHDLHKQQIWPKSGILKPREGPDTVPEIPGSRGERVLVKHWDRCRSGGTDASLLQISTAAGRFHKAEEKLLFPSFSFCWLTPVSGGAPLFFPQGWRASGAGGAGGCSWAGGSRAAGLGDSPTTPSLLGRGLFPGVGSGFAAWKSLGFGEEKGC